MADDDPTPKNDDDPKLTQADVDRIVTERVARERAKYSDYDDLKAKATRADELEAAGQSELERAQAQIKTVEGERDAAIAERDQALADTQGMKVEAAIREALPQDVVDPSVVLKLLPRDQVTVGDDGQVTGHTEAVQALLEAHPFLVGSTTPTPAPGSRDGGARGIQPPNPEDIAPGLGRLSAAYETTTPSS